jgi:O-antigen/teichoic acid export membrane protein
MVYLTKGGFWLTLAHGVAMFAGFFMSIAFANLFPKESFGNYKFILSVVAILGAFSLTGLSTSVIQSVARGFDSSLRRGFRLNLKWSVGIFLGGLFLGAYYYLNDNLILSFSFLLAGILTPITTGANLYSSYLLGKKDFRRNSLFSTIRNIVPAAAIIFALFLTENLPIIIGVYFLAGTLVSLFIYRMTLRAYPTADKAEDPELLSYSGHLSAMDVIGRVASFLDKILIFHYLGAVPLAIYAFAIAPIEQLQGGKKILSTLIQPKINERSFEELQKSAPRKAILLTIYALLLAGVYVLLAPYFYKLFYPEYLDSVFYSQIYSLTLLAVSGTVFNEALIAHKKKKELYIYRTIIPVVQVILFFILLPIYGLMGLIITHIVVRCLSTVIGYYFVRFPFKTASSS